VVELRWQLDGVLLFLSDRTPQTGYRRQAANHPRRRCPRSVSLVRASTRYRFRKPNG
jgi:hypothetical protein